jgi:hypothetical protein
VEWRVDRQPSRRPPRIERVAASPTLAERSESPGPSRNLSVMGAATRASPRGDAAGGCANAPWPSDRAARRIGLNGLGIMGNSRIVVRRSCCSVRRPGPEAQLPHELCHRAERAASPTCCHPWSGNRPGH